VENAGQYDHRVRFVARGVREAVFATDAGATVAFERSRGQRLALALTFVDASPHLRAEPGEPDPAHVNYFTGRDPSRWRTNEPTHAYQWIDGREAPIRSAFVVRGTDEYSISVGPYDHGRPLIIDPTLVYSTFLGASGFDSANAIAVDSAGAAYVAGTTRSPD